MRTKYIIQDTRLKLNGKNPLDRYIGKIAILKGNAYHGFTFEFEDGEKKDACNFYYKEVETKTDLKG